jgi:hypothetical protein
VNFPFTGPDGTFYADGYVAIVSIIVLPEQSTICVNWYPDVGAFDQGLPPVKQTGYLADTQTVLCHADIYPAAYAFLLTQPDFHHDQTAN